MKWLVVSVLLLLIVLCITKVRVKAVYKHQKDDDLFEVKVYLAFIKVYTFSAPLIRVDDDSASIIVKENHDLSVKKQKKRQVITPKKILENIEHFKDIMQRIIGFHRIVKKFLSKVSIHELKWHTEVGIGDAAHSAQLAGTIWTLKGSIIGLISHYLKIRSRPSLTVTPHFQGIHSRMFFSCIISVRIGHAIVAGLMLVKHWKKRPNWHNENSVKETI